MIQRIVLVLMLGFASVSTFANVIAGVVGDENNPVTGVSYAPDAVVFEDKLVLFYQLNTNKQKVVFSIADVDANGKLVWGEDSHSISPVIFISERFAPVPVILNDKLYLFGRVNEQSNDHAKIIYNSVNTLSDLIDGQWRDISHVHSNHNQGPTRPSGNLDRIAAITYEDKLVEPTKEKILMVYYNEHANDMFSFSSCDEFATELYCEGSAVDYDANGAKYEGAPHLTQLRDSTGHVQTYLFIRNLAGDLTSHYFSPSQHGFGPYRWYRNDNIPEQVKAANGRSMGTAHVETIEQGYIRTTTHLYYEKAGGKNIHIVTGQAGTTDWNVDNITNTNTATNQKGVKTITYKGRAYTFYIAPNGELRYFSDLITAPVAP